MKITKLHVLLLAIAVIILGIYAYQIQLEKLKRQEIALQQAQRALEVRRRELETRLNEVREKKLLVAQDAVAIAGEYWTLAKQEGRDLTRGQATLHQAKEVLAAGDADGAYTLARQSIGELKSAPLKALSYRVRPGDTLWKIAKMPRHYGSGSRWTKIWRANQKQIPDFDRIHPCQVLLIPRNKK
jgi:nucleoid-associated protein YgaU